MVAYICNLKVLIKSQNHYLSLHKQIQEYILNSNDVMECSLNSNLKYFTYFLTSSKYQSCKNWIMETIKYCTSVKIESERLKLSLSYKGR